MRKEDIILPVLIISPLIMASFLSQYLPEGLQWISSVIAFIGTISIMVVLEFYLKVKYAPYRLIKAIMVPWLVERQLLIEDIKELGDKESGYLYEIKLAVPFHHPEYGNTKTVIIESPDRLEEVLQFQPKKNVLDAMGMLIDHPSTAYAILYDSATKVDHYKPYPYLKLVPIESPELARKMLSLEESKEEGDMKNTIEKLRNKIKALEEQVKNFKMMYFNEHKKRLRIELEYEQLREEMKALLKSKGDALEIAVEHLFQIKQLYGNIIYYAEKLARKKTRDTIGKYLVYMSLIGLGGVMLYAHPEIISWMVANWIQSLVIIIVLGGVATMILRAMRGR